MFRKSSYCDTSACVEVDFERSSFCKSNDCVEVGFHKASASAENGACVEARICTCGEVLVRDSKDPDGPVLSFNGAEWSAFLAGAKAGEFDL